MTNREYMKLKTDKIKNFIIQHIWTILCILILGFIGLILCSIFIEPLFAVFLIPYFIFSGVAFRMGYEEWLDLPRKE